jgi:3-keto-5-aminohexanoate cleavage enzyme
LTNFSTKRGQKLEKQLDVQWYIDGGFGDPFEFDPKPKNKLIINAAITGNVPKKRDTPFIPLSTEEIIASAEKCYNAGARIIHLHARDEKGNPTYKASSYEEIISGIRRKRRDLVICVTTSGRTFNTFKRRSQTLWLEGELKPDMASLTIGSMNFPKQASLNSPRMIKKLAGVMVERGIKPELEVFETGMINYAAYLKRKGVLKGNLYFNMFLGSLGTMPARISDLDHLINTLPNESVWAGAGIGRFQLPINIASITRGGNVRVGLEDNIYFDSLKKTLATNEQLIKRLADFSKKIGRNIATPQETRKMLGLNSETN